MKAAVVRQFRAPLVVEDRPDPVAGPGQVVVLVEACGLCHTDIRAAQGDWPVRPTRPFVPGHEGVGLVESLGAGVSSLAVGDRVAHAAGRTTVSYETRVLGAVNEAFDEVLKSRARARLVFDMSEGVHG